MAAKRAVERHNRRAEFERVMDFLDERGYHVEYGWGRDSQAAHRSGHTLRLLGEEYEDPEGSHGLRRHG